MESRTPLYHNFNSNESCHVSNGDEVIFQLPITDASQAVLIDATNAQSSITSAAEDPEFASGDNPTYARAPSRAPSCCSSALSSIPPLPSPTPPSPSLPAEPSLAEDRHPAAMMIDTEHTDTVQEAWIN